MGGGGGLIPIYRLCECDSEKSAAEIIMLIVKLNSIKNAANEKYEVEIEMTNFIAKLDEYLKCLKVYYIVIYLNIFHLTKI